GSTSGSARTGSRLSPTAWPLRQRNETLVPVRSNARESRFHCVRHDGYPAWPSLLPGSAAIPFLRRSFCVLTLLSAGFRVPFRRDPGMGRATRHSDASANVGSARRGCCPAVAAREGTLGVTVRLLNATDSSVTDSKQLTATSYRSR